ncbi:sulfatase family protein [Galbibacter mesophilus]|uniref:sulfatase family protein n=1 Tax=Galbibacter mesophilus TaxID=379069 RepID=UPI00191CF766|nr:sulfatase [Galbibacter mesophilus]MCM5664338.1 sulfatase [Galbibacter mesophilus]
MMRTSCTQFCLFFLLIIFSFQLNGQQKKKPNILLITADDLGLQVGAYGDTIARTPNIDKLAREGVRFTNGYVTQASCSSSRSSILTGLYPHQNGQLGLSHMGFSMYDSILTLPQILHQQGYKTGIIGKLHVEPVDKFPFDFEYAKNNSSLTRNVRAVANKAANFIKETEESPFFLMVNYLDPHFKFIPQVEGLPKNPYNANEIEPFPFQLIDTEAQKRRIANFYSCIARLDDGIGMLMEELVATGKAENTLIIFVGDHGAPFNRGKTSCYEAGVKIPYIIQLLKEMSTSKEVDALVSTVDIMPTILEVANIEVEHTIEGKSLLPIIDGDEDEWRTHLYSEFFYHGPKTYYPRYAVRNNRYKLIYNVKDTINPILSIDSDNSYKFSQEGRFDGTLARQIFNRFANPPKFELYDLYEDPNELYNLSDDEEKVKILSELKSNLQQWMIKTNASQS